MYIYMYNVIHPIIGADTTLFCPLTVILTLFVL